MNKHLANVNGWSIGAVLIIILLFLPNMSIVVGIFSPASENWAHIKEFMLLKLYKIDSHTRVLYSAVHDYDWAQSCLAHCSI